jgi:hypothetical protein
MRFEICETVYTPDHEKVLHALEICSREVSSNVVRYGDRITVQGLGPSPRSKNVRDTTVFRVNAEDDKTIINGEVSFQASALLGDRPQGDVVRSKLEELFNQMKAQIDLDAKRAMRAGAMSPNTTVVPDSVVAIAPTPSKEGSLVTLAPKGKPETTSASPEPGLADTVPVAESESATGLEHTAELEHNELPFPNAVEEAPAKLDRSVWLDELFHRMKAQFELDERLATHADAAASFAAPLPETTVAADSVVATDISEKADGETVVPDVDPKIMSASSKSKSEPDAELVAHSEKSAEPEQAATLEQNAEVDQAVKHERSVLPEQDFDLKENAWLHDLFHQMNAQIDRDERLAAHDATAAASIHAAPPPTIDAMGSSGTEGIPVEEAVGTDAPSTKPKVTSAAEPELAAGLERSADSERVFELDQNLVMEPDAELERNPESVLSIELEKSAAPQQTAPLLNGAEAVHASTAKPSGDPAKDIWLEELKEVIESDLHIRRRVEEGVVTGEDGEASPRKRLAMWVTGLVVLLLVAAGSYSLYRPRYNPVAPSVEAIEQPAAITTNPVPASEPSPPADVKPPLPPIPTQIVNPAAQVADIRVWLDNWAAAMRTRNASAQASFYADTVNEYVGKYDVSNDAVLKDREATIHMRKGLWTVKMEKVVIERQTKSEVEVQLIKHFIDEPVPSEIVESFVPTRLTLKRLDGSWKITSEQDMSASSPAPATR